ncbi:GNAT family N-acetyltransferase [Paenibacillus endoradicis]|uniref:GNAT family N-acetyltransferase n=1 Tax=Paenibacillus endoradicis TaxID=2972487 RepID=UPI0021595D94|nr:GNAT family N-acetyltransferase [Paenibacillus endoradicis]MCR8659673.1 GNAT family N-acetyltransferase [Paenibacillus endoradicis]
MISQLEHIEALSLNHWPALQTKEIDGWKLRTANGFTKRANCVSTLLGSNENIIEKIARCEQYYDAIEQPTIFKLTPFSEPSLDGLLDQLNYIKQDVSLVMTMPLEKFHPVTMSSLQQTDEVKFTLLHHISIKWIEQYCKLSGTSEQLIPTIIDMMVAIQGEIVCCSCSSNNEVLAVGLAVIDNQYISLYNIITAEQHRNKGIARALITELLNVGMQNGAHTSYIQVLSENPSARHLYEKLGYREQYPYWYRVKND